MKTLRLWFKLALTKLGLGAFLTEFCHRCGARQLLFWWCEDAALWARINTTAKGVLCPECFDIEARRLGILICWCPNDEWELKDEENQV